MTASSLPRREALAEGVEFYSLYDDRFKTVRLTAALLLPMREETAAAGAAAPPAAGRLYGIPHPCRPQPAAQRVVRCAYQRRRIPYRGNPGPDFDSGIAGGSLRLRRGTGGGGMRRSVVFPAFDPAREEDRFPSADMEQERRCLIERIQAEINDKRLYARRRCSQLLCQGGGIRRPLNGTVEAAASLTTEEMTAFWRDAAHRPAGNPLSGKRRSRSCGGGFPSGGFAGADRTPVVLSPARPPREQGAVRRVTERLDVNQSKLVMGLRSPVTASLSSPEEVAAMRLMNALLGGHPIPCCSETFGKK